jgi:hypothetical protein
MVPPLKASRPGSDARVVHVLTDGHFAIGDIKDSEHFEAASLGSNR